MSLWVVYDHPRDFPDCFVVRRHDIFRGDQQGRASGVHFTADTLEAIRQRIPQGMVCIGRYEEDDPAITEVWI